MKSHKHFRWAILYLSLIHIFAVNPCKKKHLTAVRSSGADEALTLVTPVVFSLEEAIEFISDDELIEVTPKSIRLRKRILNTELRLKAQSKKNKQQK